MNGGSHGSRDERWRDRRRKAADFGKRQGKKVVARGVDEARGVARQAAAGAASKVIEKVIDMVSSSKQRRAEERTLVSRVLSLGNKLVATCQTCDAKVGDVKSSFQDLAREARESRRTRESQKVILRDLHWLAEDAVGRVCDAPWPAGAPIPPTVANAIEKLRSQLDDLDESLSGDPTK